MKWWKIGALVLALIGIFVGVRYVMTPAPGQSVPDMGHDHVASEAIVKTNYNSNPPTSGPHLATWVKPGIYTAPQPEGELIHSLEHGYVIISYNCTIHLGAHRFFPAVYAHDEEDGEASPGAQTNLTPEATASARNESQTCKDFLKELEELARRKKLFKLIVVPRPQLDTTIALTAWAYIDKFDQFDARRIERFIDYHRDHGPEQTME